MLDVMGLLRRHTSERTPPHGTSVSTNSRSSIPHDAAAPAEGSALPMRIVREVADGGDAARPIRESDGGIHSSDLVEVPAAVVCLVCDNVDCPGCEDGELSRSGIVAVVAWERIGQPLGTRLWSTARSTTRDAETFFELLPDGPLLTAFRFAVLCEIIAATAMFVAFLPVVALVAPQWLEHLLLDAHARGAALRALVLGIPSFAGLLVFAHLVHALFIDLGARSNGSRRSRSRALRFGLYACGWDLVMGPFGIVVVALKEGLKAASDALEQAERLFRHSLGDNPSSERWNREERQLLQEPDHLG